jgi:hypothetical protein
MFRFLFVLNRTNKTIKIYLILTIIKKVKKLLTLFSEPNYGLKVEFGTLRLVVTISDNKKQPKKALLN